MKLAVINIGDQLKLDTSGSTSIGSVFPVGPGQAGFFPFFWTIIKNVYILTGIVLLVMIIVGGIGMIANAGNSEKQKQSSQTISSALIGYLIMFVAYWLVKIIEVITGKTIFL
jgi:hypothetical protein